MIYDDYVNNIILEEFKNRHPEAYKEMIERVEEEHEKYLKQLNDKALWKNMQYGTYIEEQLEHAVKKQKEKQVNKRAEILDAAKEIVCNDRERQYGSPEDNFRYIAELWTTYLYNDNIGSLNAKDVAIMMALFKIGRMMSGKPKEDNWIDAIGYLACGAELDSVKGGDAK